MYPLGQDYFHELNPYFLFNYHNKEIFKISKLVTVRDGLLSFSNFILGNFTDFSSLESGPMLIHPDLAPLVPPTLRDQLSKNSLKQFGIEAASKILKGIYSNPSQQFSGFNEFFKEVHNAYLFSPQTYINEKKELKPIYKKIYSSYVRYN